MNKKQGINHSLFVIGLTIIFLLGIYYLPAETTVFGIEIKQVDMLGDIRKYEKENEINYEDPDNYEDYLDSLDNDLQDAEGL